ncbi:MAG: GNAT family N-acetyltransferase [Cereibacter sphaeroides]|uniref:GNAT family N-acetyltransferase n=1 Tax=Cereibacter sphaeroides TaxID=1063 RepID=A0A2W5URR8_CERSP|nr:MAG: GNAT family N-acetyltransferase [Cereibacter sphaeroides]
MAVTLRRAVAADAPAVMAIYNHYIRHTTVNFSSTEKTRADILDLLSNRPAFFVTERDGQILGFATYAQFRASDGYARCMEHTILLLPEVSGAGLGRALLTAVEDHARARGAHTMFAGVAAENEAGRAFHSAMGYNETFILRETGWKFGRWLDLVLMQKFLS